VAPIYTPTKEDTEAYCVVVRQFQWEVSAIEEWDRTTPPLTVTQEEMAEYHRRADRWMFPKWSKDKRKPLDDWTADRTRQEWREAGDELTAKERKALWNPAHCCIEHCRFQDLQVKPHSATTIIADIPYDEKFITGNVKDLAEGCKDWLRPGGVAAIMGGGKWLDKIIDLMRAGGMFYRWQLCYWMKDSRGSPVPGVYPGVLLNQWKSITLFAPDRHPIESIHMDFIESDPADKRLHEWQQDEGGFLQLMENITPKRDVLVIDPVVGWGTTAICALRTGRRFVGCDIDKSRVADARLRCEAWWAGNPDERK
jgi:hypothetical protein